MSLLRVHVAVAATVTILIYGERSLLLSSITDAIPFLMLALFACIAVGWGETGTGSSTARQATRQPAGRPTLV